jgi:hypothetical protein
VFDPVVLQQHLGVHERRLRALPLAPPRDEARARARADVGQDADGVGGVRRAEERGHERGDVRLRDVRAEEVRQVPRRRVGVVRGPGGVGDGPAEARAPGDEGRAGVVGV